MSLFYVGHPRETDLALFAGGELGPLARWRIEKHLQSCEPCRTAVADFFHLQGDLEELSELPSSVDWAGMSLRIRKAVSVAGETQSEPIQGHFFPKPPAWQLGMATAAVICGFIVVRQFPLPVAEDAGITAADEQNAVSSEARSLEGGEALPTGGSAAPSESYSKPSSREQQRENQPLSDVDAVVPARAVERAEKFARLGTSFARQIADVGASIAPPTDGSEIVVDVKTDGGVRFRRVDASTGRITITDVYAQ